MIFAIPGHIDLIRQGIKTQTRRISKGKYRVGKSYAVQLHRGQRAVEDMRIVIDDIHDETQRISEVDAKAEGNYTPGEFEDLFSRMYIWSRRWVLVFHKIDTAFEA